MADIYQIMSQKQDMTINPTGTGFIDTWEITYKVTDGPGKGTVATLTVPEDDHNVKYVDQAIRDKIAAISGVAGL
jgi:hypothetical protein